MVFERESEHLGFGIKVWADAVITVTLTLSDRSEDHDVNRDCLVELKAIIDDSLKDHDERAARAVMEAKATTEADGSLPHGGTSLV